MYKVLASLWSEISVEAQAELWGEFFNVSNLTDRGHLSGKLSQAAHEASQDALSELYLVLWSSQ